MKNHYFIYRVIQYLSLILILFSLSCEKLIEIELPDNQINTEDTFKDINTTKAALSNLYINFRNSPLFTGGAIFLSPALGQYTDELETFSTGTGLYENSINAVSSPTNAFWNSAYKDIYAINLFIEELSKSVYIDEIDKSGYLGVAYSLRALYYQYLSQLYGNIPYVNTSNYKINMAVKKNDYKEVLEYIEDDLKVSEKLMTNDSQNEEKVHLSRSVTELLLAKNYLLQQHFKEAEDYSRKIIDSGLYLLEPDISQVFKNTSTSTLWQISPTAHINNLYSPTRYASTYIFTALPPVGYGLNKNLFNSFSNDDLRKKDWIKEVTDGTTSYYHAYKYKNRKDNTDEYSIVFRIEEAYFVLMEALAYQDQIPEAVYFLNLIRQRAGLEPLSENLSKESFIDEMLNESRREFFTEGGHRFFDLKRNNRLHILKNIKPNWEDKHALLPIPESEISINPNLLPQNEGY